MHGEGFPAEERNNRVVARPRRGDVDRERAPLCLLQMTAGIRSSVIKRRTHVTEVIGDCLLCDNI
jgi:hypothetical protein